MNKKEEKYKMINDLGYLKEKDRKKEEEEQEKLDGEESGEVIRKIQNCEENRGEGRRH